MKRLSAGLLALGLAFASTATFAQSGPGRYDDGGYAGESGHYDYARVVRVDPVLGGYSGLPGQGGRCYETTTAGRYEGDGYYRDGYRSDTYRSDGYYGRDDRRGYGDSASRSMATIAGGVIGAVLGSHVGGGSGRFAATTVGSMVGGIAGREIYDQSRRNRYAGPATVRVCDPEPVRGGYAGRASGYDVTYEYGGHRYTRRMDYNPGDRVRVWVDVTPE